MKQPREAILERPLTYSERTLATWMLEQAKPEAAVFLEQLSRARVVGRCPCGCASVDFAVAGLPTPSGGLRILADFFYGPETAPLGVFIFERANILAGLEVWSPTGDDAPRDLPEPSALRPFDSSGR